MFKKQDTFLSQTHCDRCNTIMTARTMSWFTEETICMQCSEKEKIIRNQLKLKGIQDTMEGCGYIPSV